MFASNARQPAKHCTNNTVNTYCSTETHRCVECKKNKHCELEDTGNRVCDVDVNQCVECKIDSHCADDLYCDKQAKRCVECKNNNHCASNTFKQCNTATRMPINVWNVCERLTAAIGLMATSSATTLTMTVLLVRSKVIAQADKIVPVKAFVSTPEK